MSLWTEVHWSEGMFLRPHHLQSYQRWEETIARATFGSVRAFPWGAVLLEVAEGPLEDFTLRLDRCQIRMKDGTWVRIPENTSVEPRDFKKQLEAAPRGVEIAFGIPSMQEVRANAVSLEEPELDRGTPRFVVHQLKRLDENTGENAQDLNVRRMRGKLFVGAEDTTGYDVIRIGRLKRTDRPGAVPEFDRLGCGPLLSSHADRGLHALINSVSDQISAKSDTLASEAVEQRMSFSDGLGGSISHLLKLQCLNATRGELAGWLQSPMLHPFDVYVAFVRLIGQLSLFDTTVMAPHELATYDHDRPGDTFDEVARRIQQLLKLLEPTDYETRPFERVRDINGIEGLQVELDRKWIDENRELFVAFEAIELDEHEVDHKLGEKALDLKLASPRRAPRIHGVAVRGLRFARRTPPQGTLPHRQGLHYFKIDKTPSAVDNRDYWRECESERGIRMSLRADQLGDIEKLRPTLYVPIKK